MPSAIFKKVHITNRPGSTPDRVIVVVEVEDQPTGSFSPQRRLFDDRTASWRKSRCTETNFLGRGQYVRLCGSEGQYSQGWNCRSPSPISSTSGWRPASTFTIRQQQ